MKLFIDTNIVLGLLLAREPHAQSTLELFRLAQSNEYTLYISASSCTDIFYLLKKCKKNIDDVYTIFKYLLKAVKIANVSEELIYKAFDFTWKDFEDAVQFSVAEDIQADFLISRNQKDFEIQSIPVITAEEFLLNQ